MTYADLLLEWYQENKRDLPWRRTKDPYCIWVSEIMLQQTQVATVIPYYYAFLDRFPSVKDLANASLEEVHTYWQGLGYYRRGENLWRGAKLIVDKWGGRFPSDKELIKEIPGIGPYTLGAISSIAFNIPLPAVDGNVMRILSRQFCIEADISIAKNRRIFEDEVMELMPEHPSIFNQALMELGALVCTPKNPKCSICPMKVLCEGYKTNSQEVYPIKAKKIKQVEEVYKVLVVKKGNRLGLVKRGSEGLLANLWGFPMVKEEEWGRLGLDERKGTGLNKITHIFTHRKWQMYPVLLDWSKPLEEALIKNMKMEGKMQYVEIAHMGEFPIATAYIKIIKAVTKKMKV